jgi:hypothetical protein
MTFLFLKASGLLILPTISYKMKVKNLYKQLIPDQYDSLKSKLSISCSSVYFSLFNCRKERIVWFDIVFVVYAVNKDYWRDETVAAVRQGRVR